MSKSSVPDGLVDSIIAELATDLFDRPVMSNLVRPLYVERLVARALGAPWKHVGGDWAGWDLQCATGARLEVKQSAVRQTWTDGPGGRCRPTAASFDIAWRTGHWADAGSRWVSGACRPADVYVFAHHAVFDIQQVDQRDPGQWTFYVLPECRLPATQRTVGLAWLRTNSAAVAFAALNEAVATALSLIGCLKVNQPP